LCGDKPPAVAIGVQSEEENPEAARIANLAVGACRGKRKVALPSCADNELAQTVRIGSPIGVLRSEAFINVVVPV
jgi:hypothetical protein